MTPARAKQIAFSDQLISEYRADLEQARREHQEIRAKVIARNHDWDEDCRLLRELVMRKVDICTALYIIDALRAVETGAVEPWQQLKESVPEAYEVFAPRLGPGSPGSLSPSAL